MAIPITDGTVDDADAYFSTRLNSEVWTNSSEADRLAGLTTAATIFNAMTWLGRPVSGLSAFPRRYEGRTAAITPQVILWALYEQAIHLMANPDVLIEEGGVDSLVLGPIQLQKLENAPLIPKIVRRWISAYVDSSGSLGGTTWWRAN